MAVTGFGFISFENGHNDTVQVLVYKRKLLNRHLPNNDSKQPLQSEVKVKRILLKLTNSLDKKTTTNGI